MNGSSLRIALISARITMKANSATRMRQSTTPNSSAATAKTKSVWPSGRMRLIVPSPGPRPNQPPRMNDSVAMSILNVSPDAGSRKRLMRCGDVRNGEERRHQADAGRAGEPDHPDQTHARHVEQRAPDQRDQHGLAEIRLQHQKRHDDDQQSAARSYWPAFPAASPISPNSQAIRITKAGLRNSDGCMLTPRMTSQRRAPLISAPK